MKKHFPDIRGIFCCDLKEVQENKTQSSETKIDTVYICRGQNVVKVMSGTKVLPLFIGWKFSGREENQKVMNLTDCKSLLDASNTF